MLIRHHARKTKKTKTNKKQTNRKKKPTEADKFEKKQTKQEKKKAREKETVGFDNKVVYVTILCANTLYHQSHYQMRQTGTIIYQ